MPKPLCRGQAGGRALAGPYHRPANSPHARRPPRAQAQALPPEQRPVVLDLRNSYEWDAGHFVGAERPLEVCQGDWSLTLGPAGADCPQL